VCGATGPPCTKLMAGNAGGLLATGGMSWMTLVSGS
jgi:hypothetical protein